MRKGSPSDDYNCMRCMTTRTNNSNEQGSVDLRPMIGVAALYIYRRCTGMRRTFTILLASARTPGLDRAKSRAVARS